MCSVLQAARDGIIRALSISNEELAGLHTSLDQEAESQDVTEQAVDFDENLDDVACQ